MKTLGIRSCLLFSGWQLVLSATHAEVNDELNIAHSFRETSPPNTSLRASTRIFGGEPAPSLDPYMSFAQLESGCGATLIHEDILLTAGHCLSDYADIAWLGSLEYQSGDEYTISEHIPYQLYEEWPYYDIGVIKLSDPATGIEPMTIAENRGSDPIPGDELTTIGFGLTQGGNWDSKPDVLMKTKVPFVEMSVCANLYSGYDWDEELWLCAGTDTEGSCTGDSGGPLINSEGVLVGLISGGAASTCDAPMVFVRVSSMYDWIQDQICRRSSNPPESCPKNTFSLTLLFEMGESARFGSIVFERTNPASGHTTAFVSRGVGSLTETYRGDTLLNLDAGEYRLVIGDDSEDQQAFHSFNVKNQNGDSLLYKSCIGAGSCSTEIVMNIDSDGNWNYVPTSGMFGLRLIIPMDWYPSEVFIELSKEEGATIHRLISHPAGSLTRDYNGEFVADLSEGVYHLFIGDTYGEGIDTYFGPLLVLNHRREKLYSHPGDYGYSLDVYMTIDESGNLVDLREGGVDWYSEGRYFMLKTIEDASGGCIGRNGENSRSDNLVVQDCDKLDSHVLWRRGDRGLLHSKVNNSQCIQVGRRPEIETEGVSSLGNNTYVYVKTCSGATSDLKSVFQTFDESWERQYLMAGPLMLNSRPDICVVPSKESNLITVEQCDKLQAPAGWMATTTNYFMIKAVAEDGCIGRKRDGSDELFLKECLEGDEYIQWRLDGKGRIRSKVDDSDCIQAGRSPVIQDGPGALERGTSVYVKDCVADGLKKHFQVIGKWGVVGDDGSGLAGPLSFASRSDLCVVHFGADPVIGESRIMLIECNSLGGGRALGWEAIEL